MLIAWESVSNGRKVLVNRLYQKEAPNSKILVTLMATCAIFAYEMHFNAKSAFGMSPFSISALLIDASSDPIRIIMI